MDEPRRWRIELELARFLVLVREDRQMIEQDDAGTGRV